MRPIFSIILVFIYLNSDAQTEDQKWIFNFFSIDSCHLSSEYYEICGASILDFSSIPPNIYREERLTLDMNATNTSICDSEGELLLYSNGQAIQGPNHTPIENGDTINYSPKWDWLTYENEFGEVKPSGMKYAQSTGFFRNPFSDSILYILYHNYERSEEGIYELWSSTIKKNSLGDYKIVEKDELINSNIGVPGNIHSCTHANGRDSWILQFTKDTVMTYLLTPEGLSLSHTQLLPFSLRDSNGQSKFAKLGNKFALFGRHQSQLANGSDLMISNFDRCNGLLIDSKYYQVSSIESSGPNSGLEFSPDGNLLYISYGFKVIQYDLNASDLISSGIEVAAIENTECSQGGGLISFGQMNLGIDRKIYISLATQCFQVHRIDFPNKRGSDCNLIQNAITLPTYHFGTSPNFNTFRLSSLDGSPCDTLGLDNNPISKFWYEQDINDHQEIQFRDVSYYRPEEWSWTFGDGNTSDEMSPLHTYASNGVYEVCLTVSNENSSNTSCQELQIGPVANQNIRREYDINIFPNPVEDVTRLVFSDYLPEEARIVLYDASGQKVFADRVYQECMIDLSGLGAGIYLYEILDGIEFLSRGKIIKI